MQQVSDLHLATIEALALAIDAKDDRAALWYEGFGLIAMEAMLLVTSRIVDRDKKADIRLEASMCKLFTSEMQQKISALNTILQENLAGIKVIKAFTREKEQQVKFHGAAGRE